MTNLKLWMNRRQIWSNLISDESGQDLIEYALVAAIIALGATAAMGVVATDIKNVFTNIGKSLTTAA